MKKLFFLTALLFSAPHIFSQTLFTYGKDAVSKDEFLRAYNKNKIAGTDKAQSYKDYLDLYIKFKLKVKAAKEKRLDTLQQLQADIDGFRSQVEEGYMNDEKGVNELTEEVLARQKKEIHTQHFYVPINAAMSSTDSIKAVKLIEAAYAALQKGRKDYNELAGELSAEYKMVIKTADLGYVTALSVPYEYENIIYGLAPEKISTPHRTKKAIHIFKNIDERPNSGKWKAAQILLVFPPDASDETKNKIKQKADSIHNLIKSGADFAETAKRCSDDRNTYMAGGEMAEFTTGKFDLSFENAVFALQKDGDVTAPILTSYGYHIVKRLKHTPYTADVTDENFMYELKQKIQQDGRINKAKDKFLKDVLVKIGYKKNPAISDQEIIDLADSVKAGKSIEKIKIPANKASVFSFNNKQVRLKDWLKYVKDFVPNSLQTAETSKSLFDKYLNESALAYYRKNLEKYNSDFKYQMQEFKEGNMLFEIMERNVWSKAANDSVGLKKFYNQHKSKYLWEESADVIIFNCSDAATATHAIADIKAGVNWKQIAEESNATIQADSGRYEISQLPTSSRLSEGYLTNTITNPADGTVSFVQALKMYPAKEQRNFDEARGLVTNEYQNYLEEKWIEALKKKYPVKVNEALFKSIIQ
ncbi:peptidylprolyl isomerase [Ferruginibacter sp. SUN002]|uniref:peptidylprolyl isomerase n=1 Tax=Ferruginibacter sp. SUN002 TaxID=2937789 RepID=UPI003D369550